MDLCICIFLIIIMFSTLRPEPQLRPGLRINHELPLVPVRRRLEMTHFVDSETLNREPEGHILIILFILYYLYY